MFLRVPNSTINESEFNNVHRNMVKMVFNINDNAHDPQGENSGEQLSRPTVKRQRSDKDNNHGKNVNAKHGSLNQCLSLPVVLTCIARPPSSPVQAASEIASAVNCL